MQQKCKILLFVIFIFVLIS